MKVVNLYEDNIAEIVDVLCESFYEYPVMRYVLGEKDDYHNRLRMLVRFFVETRVLKKEPMFGIYDSSNILAAAAIVTLPGDNPQTEELKRRRDILWKELGSIEQTRYENYGKAASGLLPNYPHHHLNMIGVRQLYKGRGFARQVITAVEDSARLHPHSSGISLNTEYENNVNLYLHLGYKLTGKANVNENLETWGFFKAI